MKIFAFIGLIFFMGGIYNLFTGGLFSSGGGAEGVGYNLGSILMLIYGIWSIYYLFFKKKELK